MTYTDLIFDLYGTLVDIHTEESNEVWEKTALYFGFYGAHYTGTELKSAFLAALAEKKQAAKEIYAYPDLPFDRIMSELFAAKGVKENCDTLAANAEQLFRIASIEYIRLYPGVIEALRSLRKQGFRLWLLTNAQRVFTEYELRYLELDKWFDGIYISSDYGCRKPDPLFFRTLLDEQKLDPARCLMIGNDRDTDIAGAKAVGLASIYMHTNLTPFEQEEASPALLPENAPADCRHYEYEGWDWAELIHFITAL